MILGYQGTAIMGQAEAAAEQMSRFVLRVNPGAPDLARLYLELGQQLGVRGDLAYAQAIHETDYFRFTGVVRPEQNNYAGIGATGPNEPGHTFTSPEEGVLAHLQHLFAYASTDPLPEGMENVDPRFGLVERGVAPYIGDLNGRWAVPGTNYGQMIDRLLGGILVEPWEQSQPADQQPVVREPYEIVHHYLDQGSQNRPGRCTSSGCWEGVRGIVVHRTASDTMDAHAIRRYFNDAPDGRFASSQFVLDNNVILQLMPIGEVAYHTAGKNFTTLGIETCEHNWGTETWPETYRKLVWLTAHLVREHNLTISDVTGHFYWDPVNRPYDPTHMGWMPGDNKVRGVFEWNRFIADVAAELEAGSDQSISVVVRREEEQECTTGRVMNGTTYVPIRPIAACLAPGAEVHWQPEQDRVLVDLSSDEGGEPEPPADDEQEIQVVVRAEEEQECTTGLVRNGTTYVPIRPYTDCVAPGAEVHWQPEQDRVLVNLAQQAGQTGEGSPGQSESPGDSDSRQSSWLRVLSWFSRNSGRSD